MYDHLHGGGGRGGDVLQGLDVHGVGGLPLQHLVEGHQEELVLGGLPEAGDHHAVRVLALQHRHDVEFLAAATPVPEPVNTSLLEY